MRPMLQLLTDVFKMPEPSGPRSSGFSGCWLVGPSLWPVDVELDSASASTKVINAAKEIRYGSIYTFSGSQSYILMRCATHFDQVKWERVDALGMN